MEWPGLMVRPAIESINSPLGPTVSKIALNSGCMKSRRNSAMESSICCVSMGSFMASRMRAAVSISIMQKEWPFATRPSRNLGSNNPGVFL